MGEPSGMFDMGSNITDTFYDFGEDGYTNANTSVKSSKGLHPGDEAEMHSFDTFPARASTPLQNLSVNGSIRGTSNFSSQLSQGTIASTKPSSTGATIASGRSIEKRDALLDDMAHLDPFADAESTGYEPEAKGDTDRRLFEICAGLPKPREFSTPAKADNPFLGLGNQSTLVRSIPEMLSVESEPEAAPNPFDELDRSVKPAETAANPFDLLDGMVRHSEDKHDFSEFCNKLPEVPPSRESSSGDL